MKKIGTVQMAHLVYQPSIYTFDEISHRLIFNRQITNEDLKKIIIEFGKEITTIKNIRAVSNSLGTLQTKRELDMVIQLEQDLIAIYNNLDDLSCNVINGSGKIELNNTLIKFYKPKMVDFDEDSNQK